MKRNFPILILLFSIFLFDSSFAQISSQEKSIEKKPTSVIVMPFFIDERYPYSSDEIRQYLMWGFYQRRFNVISDDSSWSKVLVFDYQLSNISSEMADSIANAVNADLIIYGTVNSAAKYRPGGIYTNPYVPNPILIKAYDKKKKSIVFFERMDFVEHWGLFTTNISLQDFGFRIATKLSELGY
ncbi:MAG: hypothetical protein AB1775_08080 [Bacteroidota bacterium]